LTTEVKESRGDDKTKAEYELALLTSYTRTREALGA
jgi:hypothetical protein